MILRVRRHASRRRKPSGPRFRLALTDRAERLSGGDAGEASLASRDIGVGEHALVHAGAITSGKHRRHACPHPLVGLRYPSAERGAPVEASADQMQKLDARCRAKSKADRVALDFPLAAGDRRLLAVDSDEHDRLDLADAPACLAERVTGENRHATTSYLASQLGIAGDTIAYLDNAGDGQAVLERQRRRVEPEAAATDDDDALGRERAIANDECARGVGTHDARALPARKAQRDVARAGG